MTAWELPDHDFGIYRDIGFPDPFAVATIQGEQTKTTSVIKKTLNPYWNESFDMQDIMTYFFGDSADGA